MKAFDELKPIADQCLGNHVKPGRKEVSFRFEADQLTYQANYVLEGTIWRPVTIVLVEGLC